MGMLDIFKRKDVDLSLPMEVKAKGVPSPGADNYFQGINSFGFENLMKQNMNFKKGMRASGVVFACIDKKASSVAQVDWVVQSRPVGSDEDAWVDDPSSPLARLIRNPNPYFTQNEIMYRLAAGLDLYGSSFMTKIRVGGDVQQIWVRHSKNVTPVRAENRFLSHYSIKEKNFEQGRRYSAKDVLALGNPHMDDFYKGYSPIQSIAMEIDTDVAAQQWQRASLKNSGVPSGVLNIKGKYKPTVLDKLRQKLESLFTGAANARKWMVMSAESGLEWVKLDLTAQELDFLNSRGFHREQICAAFKVPPPVLGFNDNATLSNLGESREIFWVDTVLPICRRIQDVLNRDLVTDFNTPETEYRVIYDINGIEALVPLFNKKLDGAQALFQLGVPLRVINKRLNLGLPNDIPFNDTGFVPVNMMNIEFLVENDPRGNTGSTGVEEP